MLYHKQELSIEFGQLRTDVLWLLACGRWHASVSDNYQKPKLKLSNYCEYYYLRSSGRQSEEECQRLLLKLGQTFV